MKHYHLIALLWALLLCVPTQAEVHPFISPSLSPPVDKQTEIKANLRQAKYMMENGNYTGAKEKLERVLFLDPENSEAKRLLAQCQMKIDQQMKDEREAFQKACERGTSDAWLLFISYYPKSQYREEAELRIADLQLWAETRRDNTIAAYRHYLKQSTLCFYRTEAEQRILELEADEAWEQCKNSLSESVLEAFFFKYPNSSHSKDAEYRICLLKGERYYSEGNYGLALTSLSDANKIYRLTGTPAQHLKSLIEEKEYGDIRYSNDEKKVMAYLAKLSSDSPYFNPTSNRLALILARKLNGYSSDYDMDVALAYAKDGSTRATVQQNIKRAKAERFSFKSWLKGRLLFGVKLDVDKNVYEPSWAFNGGVVLKLGKYTDLINFMLGVDFRFYVFDKFPKKKALADVAQDAYITGGQIVIPITARFNFLRITESWRLYVGISCNIQNKIHDNFNILKPHCVSFEPQTGLVSRHWDVGLYFKKFAKTPYFIDCRSNYIGIHGAYYF